MRRFAIPLVVTIVAGLACGPIGAPALDGSGETSSGAELAGDGDGDGDAAGDGDGDATGDGDGEPNGCAVELDAEIAVVLADLQAIVDGAIAYFEAEHIIYDCDWPGCEPEPIDFPLHHCPFPIGQPVAGECGTTPPLGFNCNEGPECKCVPVSNGGGLGQYDPALWHYMWQSLGFAKDAPHAFHYNFTAYNETSGYGGCSFTAQAYGDLDDDAVFSTYQIAGTIDENGVTLEPLHVELGDE